MMERLGCCVCVEDLMEGVQSEIVGRLQVAP